MWSTTYDEKNKLWKGSDLPSCDRSMSIASVILKSLHSGGSKIAQINASTGTSLSFDDIRIRTIRVAKNLQARNLATKQIFGIVAMNHDHLAPIVFASFSLGCTVYPIDILYTKFEFGQKFKKIKPKVIFCDISAYDVVLESLAELNHQAKFFTFGGQKGASEDVEHLFAEVDDETDIM
ncbi:hypothetical protein HA402_003984 [Bradysia odoriphaga]|nr:hypothetical protein HA402_003984 [Bradysia odoriphaga]